MMHKLDLRGVACPINFVKTKIFLDNIAIGDTLVVILDAGEPVESVYSSILAEGHNVQTPEKMEHNAYVLSIEKVNIV